MKKTKAKSETSPVPELSECDQREFEELIAKVKAADNSCFQSSLEKGKALRIMSDKGFDTHGGTVQEFCRRILTISPARYYQLIDAAKTMEALSTNVDTPRPTSEGQLRPLAKLKPEDRSAVWKAACEASDGNAPTGAVVAKMVENHLATSDHGSEPGKSSKEGKLGHGETDAEAGITKVIRRLEKDVNACPETHKAELLRRVQELLGSLACNPYTVTTHTSSSAHPDASTVPVSRDGTTTTSSTSIAPDAIGTKDSLRANLKQAKEHLGSAAVRVRELNKELNDKLYHEFLGRSRHGAEYNGRLSELSPERSAAMTAHWAASDRYKAAKAAFARFQKSQPARAPGAKSGEPVSAP